jgi:hypothetical protein
MVTFRSVIRVMGVETVLVLARPDALASGITRPSVKLVVTVEVWADAAKPLSRAIASRPDFNLGVGVAPTRHWRTDAPFVRFIF